MKKIVFLSLIILFSCKVPTKCKIEKTFAKENIKVANGNISYKLEYKVTDKKNRPTLIIQYSKNGTNTNDIDNYSFSEKNKITKRKLNLIFENIYKKNEVFKLSNKELEEFNKQKSIILKDILANLEDSRLLIKSNKKLRKKGLNYLD